MNRDFTPQLRSQLQAINLNSFQALSQAAGVSRRSIDKLRRGELATLSLGTLQRLAMTLQLSLLELLTEFGGEFKGEFNGLAGKLEGEGCGELDGMAACQSDRPAIATIHAANPSPPVPMIVPAASACDLATLQAEYDRLQTEFNAQPAALQTQFETEALAKLESFLTFYPVAAARARQDTQLPAVNILPLLKPIEQMLTAWQVQTIGTIGETVAFDPQHHQLIEPFPPQPIQPGDWVHISHCGYWHRDRLLMRAKVRAGAAPQKTVP